MERARAVGLPTHIAVAASAVAASANIRAWRGTFDPPPCSSLTKMGHASPATTARACTASANCSALIASISFTATYCAWVGVHPSALRLPARHSFMAWATMG